VWVIAAALNRGETPEEIQAHFPSLSLAQVQGVVGYYQDHREDLDARFSEDQRAYDEWWATYRGANAEFHDVMEARFEAARKQRRTREARLGEATGA
jgi:hypothetical protein